MKFILFILLLISAQLTYSQETKPNYEKLALKYMEAYSDWNFEKMGTFYDDSVHFVDPTAQEAFKNSFEHTGKENVVNNFKRIFNGGKPEYVKFIVHDHFISGTYVIINSTFESILPNEWFGDKAKGKVFVSIPVMTILRFKGDKIISHTDYADYNRYSKQISIQLKE